MALGYCWQHFGSLLLTQLLPTGHPALLNHPSTALPWCQKQGKAAGWELCELLSAVLYGPHTKEGS